MKENNDEELVGQDNQKSFSLINFFVPVPGYFVTPLLIIINILIFAIMALSGVNLVEPDTQSLLQWGANFRPSTLDGQWWRLISSCFIHIGIIHLLMNMYALSYIGMQLEPLLGRFRFLLAYFLTGLAGSVASIWWNQLTVSAGASGAIFGMYGVFLAMLTTSLIEKSQRSALLTSMLVFVGFNLANGLRGDIDNAGHIGGLLTGIICGYGFYYMMVRRRSLLNQYLHIGLLSSLILSAIIWVLVRIPDDIGTYEREMTTFMVLESKALEPFTLPEETSSSILASALRNKGIASWEENLRLLDRVANLDLPEVFQERNVKLKRYCELRIRSYRLLIKSIEEDSDAYDAELESLNQEILTILQELNGEN